MRNLRVLDEYRDASKQIVEFYGNAGDETCGVFRMPSPIDGQTMIIVAAQGNDWDHVSVSRTSRCPNWPEMEFIRRMFFNDDETVVQFHVPRTDHINVHPYCLHMWRPQKVELPRPPGWMVGPT